MPNSPDSTTQAPDTVHRTVRLRLYPGDAATGILLTAIAGTCRHVWNHMLADCEWRYARWKEMYVPAANWPEVRAGQTAWAKAVRKRMGPKPSVACYTLYKRFTELRDDPDHAWLQDYPFACVRDTLKYLADAYTRFLNDPRNEGRPRFKARHCTVPAFTIPSDVQIGDGRLRVPKVGWLRLAGLDRYAGCKPLTVRVRMEGTEQHPQWYAYVCYAVPAEQVRPPAADGALGLDRNVGQATDSNGSVRHIRHGQAGWADRPQAAGAEPQAGLGPEGQTVQVEPGPARERATLQAAPQTGAPARQCHASGQPHDCGDGAHRGGGGSEHEGHDPVRQGHGGEPGRQVKQKSGLNRSLLASGWGSLERKLAYTSQTCSRCSHVHRDNRPSQAVFTGGACGFQANADHNAAINILVRAGLPSVPVSARGTGAATRRGAIPWGPRRPVNRICRLFGQVYESLTNRMPVGRPGRCHPGVKCGDDPLAAGHPLVMLTLRCHHNPDRSHGAGTDIYGTRPGQRAQGHRWQGRTNPPHDPGAAVRRPRAD
ncbi:MAG: transposase [Caldilineaceae bacterium]|nr:transposase [Caldilineaceae bacterium]